MAIYIDTESALDAQFLTAIGVDVDKMLYIPLDTIEDVFEAMEDIIVKIRENNKIKKEYEVKDEDGPIRYSFQASRYDYLRIAKAILDDWQNDTCVGKYLKSIHERKISKNYKYIDDKLNNRNAKSYAGFFHTSYSGMAKRNVMGMHGWGGHRRGNA